MGGVHRKHKKGGEVRRLCGPVFYVPFTISLLGHYDSGKIEFFNTVVTDPEEQCPKIDPERSNWYSPVAAFHPRITRSLRGAPKQYEVRLYFGQEKFHHYPTSHLRGVLAWLYFLAAGPFPSQEKKQELMLDAQLWMKEIPMYSRENVTVVLVVLDFQKYITDLWLDVAKPIALYLEKTRDPGNFKSSEPNSLLAPSDFHFERLPSELVAYIYCLLDALIQADNMLTMKDLQQHFPCAKVKSYYFGSLDDERFIDRIFEEITILS